MNILNEKTFNLIILDLMLPDISGEEICKMVRKTSDLAPIAPSIKSSLEKYLPAFWARNLSSLYSLGVKP